MYGWRARIGGLIPTTNTIVEAEFNRLAPEGVSIHASRMNLRQATVRGLEKMNTYMERAVKWLTPANVDVIAFVGTSASLLRNIEFLTNHLRSKRFWLTFIIEL
ncbi:MAG: hypothetical protein GTN80_06185 [Nitrososphaeria archaeon]|nr:hypothetical protein [Nitrososphaeria archaeon]NIQ33214.1 hypothetical protein [Nitrososphaeria archaeon]